MTAEQQIKQTDILKVAQDMISGVITHINDGNLESASNDAGLYIESLEKSSEKFKPLDSALSFLHILQAFVHRVWKDQGHEGFDPSQMNTSIHAVKRLTSTMTHDDRSYTANLLQIIQSSEESGDALINKFIYEAFK